MISHIDLTDMKPFCNCETPRVKFSLYQTMCENCGKTEVANMSNDTRINSPIKLSDTGEIYTQKSESSDCVCCEGNHIFSIGIHWDNRKDFYSLFQEMVSKVDKHKAHGKKVKISIELI